MITKYKIEIIFKSEHRALQFKGDMLNLEAYDIIMGPIISLNSNGAPAVSANPNDFSADPNDYRSCVPHVIQDKHIDLISEPEIDYPDGDEG